jgi:CHAT domain-containing protein/Flp pilus assembly protein TadD
MKRLSILPLLLFFLTQLFGQGAYKKFIQLSYAELDSLNNLESQKGNYDKAIPYAQAAKEKAKNEYGEQDSIFAEYAFKLGFLYGQQGQHEEAEANYLIIKNIFAKKLGEQHPKYAQVINDLGLLYGKAGYYEKAEPLMLEAINIFKKHENTYSKSLISGLNNLAVLYQKIGKFEKSETLLLQSQKIIEKTVGRNSPEYARSYNNLGMVYLLSQKRPTAETAFIQAKNLWAETVGKQHPEYAATLLGLAKLYAEMREFKKAELLFFETNSIWKNSLGFEHPNTAVSYNQLAGFYLLTGQLDTALYYIKQSFDANSNDIDSSFTDFLNFDKYDYYSYIYQSSFIKTFLAILSAKYKKTNAHSDLENYYEMQKAVIRFNNRVRNNYIDEADKMRILANNNKIILDAIQSAISLQKNNFIEEIFSFAEMDKAVLLMGAIKTEQAYHFGSLPDSLILQEKKLIQEQSLLKANLLKQIPKAIKDSLYVVLNNTNYQIESFSKMIKTQYPQYAAIKYDNNALSSILDIQTLLDNKTALIEYVISDSVLHIFKVTKNDLIWIKQPLIDSSLKANIISYHAVLSDYKALPNKKENIWERYTNLAYWFYLNILEPVLKDAKGIENLIIVTDGELGHLPFETFLVKKAPAKGRYKDLHYLLKDYNISYNYSATLWKENKESKKSKNNGQLLAMAANYESKGDSALLGELRLSTERGLRDILSPLPAARAEVEALQKAYKGYFAFDNSASEKMIKKLAPEYAIIHLAMHGLLDEKRPMLSSLAFTEDGDSVESNFLEAHEISKMELNADLVVLSACETGYGKFETGNGIASLARAFMYAGAPALVVSLWQVNDESTGKLMQLFYENLAKGLPKDEALRKAKLKYIAEAKNPMAAHPAFWSPFILIGDNAPVKIQRKGNYLPWLIGGGVLVLVFGGLFLRKKIKAAA